ncbi:alpha/beta fold hydrolase [Novosphingobium sp. P6W]|uniref:alpha/beta fold hydrolase n=1 Tax=Novosphingobium sp. P6W TaxID=1609758 RepID=UPI0005C2AAAD|nr:alpha/beta hydrolase [Novosphingobium sp. P6W]AXB80069.1 alpha/beta hydrolase [Novosphingobium sp. P6W]KIS30256.1 alpha/beta hydrolase [Novosphingobium sp. P6W]
MAETIERRVALGLISCGVVLSGISPDNSFAKGIVMKALDGSAQAQPRMRRAYVDGPYGQIHYLDAERGRPLVLLHQAIMTANQFDYVFEPLIKLGFRPIAIDLPGFGLSDPTPFVPKVSDYAPVVPAVLDALGISRAAIVGHHTGALVVNEVAINYPERVSANVMCGPLFISEEQRAALIADICGREKAFTALPHAAHMNKVAEARERYAGTSVSAARISDYVVQAMMAMQRGAYWYGHNAGLHYRQEDALMKISQPTLLLTNTGDLLYESAKIAKNMRPDFIFKELQGGGIDIVDQQPEEWSSSIADFLSNHPQ